MKRLVLLVGVTVLALGGVAEATLSKARARLEAEVTAYDFASRRGHLTDTEVGACRRRSANRINCSARASGDDFIGCETDMPYDCHYVFRSCTFTVAVHEAGYSALGRVRGVSCTTREHTG